MYDFTHYSARVESYGLPCDSSRSFEVEGFFIDGHLTFGIFLKVNFSLKASTNRI